MSHPFYHAQSSAKKFGGQPEDYQAIHDWFDATKSHFADPRHRALRHHSLGIFEAEERFGITIKNSDGKDVPVRLIGEQHVIEDCGRVPTVADWLRCVAQEPWMRGAQRLSEKLSISSDPTACEVPSPFVAAQTADAAVGFYVRLLPDAQLMPHTASGDCPQFGTVYQVLSHHKGYFKLAGLAAGSRWAATLFEDVPTPVAVLRPPTLYQVRLRADASPTPHEETGAVPQQGEIYDVTDLGNGYPRLRGFPDAARWPRTLYEVLPDSGTYAATHSDVYGTMEFMSNEKAVV